MLGVLSLIWKVVQVFNPGYLGGVVDQARQETAAAGRTAKSNRRLNAHKPQHLYSSLLIATQARG